MCQIVGPPIVRERFLIEHLISHVMLLASRFNSALVHELVRCFFCSACARDR